MTVTTGHVTQTGLVTLVTDSRTEMSGQVVVTVSQGLTETAAAGPHVTTAPDQRMIGTMDVKLHHPITAEEGRIMIAGLLYRLTWT